VTQGAVLASIVSSAAPFLLATCRHRSIMKSSNLQANVASTFARLAWQRFQGSAMVVPVVLPPEVIISP
jgi:hypothetical protein